MQNIDLIIAKNIKAIRKENNLTQSEFAEKLNYSNKTVSRWESGEIVPDVLTLNAISETFNVELTSLFQENAEERKVFKRRKMYIGNKLAISLLSILVVWYIATIIFVYSKVVDGENFWQAFVWAIPASCVVGIIFNSIWGRRFANFIIITIFIWSLLAAVYISFLQYNIWPIFFIGIPSQIGVILAFNIRK